MSVLVSCPTTAPFANAAAHALFNASVLKEFDTTICYSPELIWQKLFARCIPKFDAQIKRRYLDLPASYVRQYPFRELVRIATSKLDSSGVVTDHIWEWAEHGFDAWVARRLNSEVKALYGFEHASLASFQRAKELQIACIYDVPAPEHEFTHAILKQETAGFPSLHTRYAHRVERRNPARTQRRHQEFTLADLVIANSEYTKESYGIAGLDTAKIQVVPYGAPQTSELVLNCFEPPNQLTLMWAGTFSVRKGAHYVIEAWEKLKLHNQVQLLVFGALDLPRELLAQAHRSGISFLGSLPRDELFLRYQSADALLFPTLTDGFGMVVTEALAHGLPVITTRSAGASYLIEQERNGLIIEAGSIDSIADAIQWCLNNRSQLHSMRTYCRESSQRRLWSDYERDLLEALKNYV